MKMKNKKQIDVAYKKQHKAALKAAKERKRGTPDLNRVEASRNEIRSFLIISEGKNTETSYFEKFKLPTVEIQVIGAGMNTHSLVEYAINMRRERNEKRQQRGKSAFDEVWCVFDVDPTPNNPQQLTNFANALDLAERNDIKVAYSNQAFEYWFILHFEDHQGGPMSRIDYHKKINSYLAPLNCSYNGKGTKEVSEDFFNEMLVVISTPGGKTATRRDLAIDRAKRNQQSHKQSNTPPAKAESSTTVYKLVEALLNR